MSEPFNPEKHMRKLQGQDYLEVKWRLVWLRDDAPDATIATELVQLDMETLFAVFKATVTLPNGGSATGYGSETQKDFRDFIEKAETKAVGRALAMLGYGTQFSGEFGEVDKADARPVDAPVARKAILAAVPQTTPTPPQSAGVAPNLITDKQQLFLLSLVKRLGKNVDTWKEELQVVYNKPVEALTRKEVSDLIDGLQRELTEREHTNGRPA